MLDRHTVLQTLQKLVRLIRLAKQRKKLRLPADLKQKIKQVLCKSVSDYRIRIWIHLESLWQTDLTCIRK